VETWKDIKGYEGLYQVSNLGRVKSLEREVNQGKYGNTRTVGGCLLNPTDNGNGYLIVQLRRKQHRKNYYVHRLVAEQFVENGSNLKYVNHKDYDTRNNRADNLEWCTQRDNILHSSQRMRKPHKQWKQSVTAEKYIYLRNGRFRLSSRGKIDRTFSTIEEAVVARGVVLHGEKYIAG
jgi:hypothetical protein